MDDHATVLTFKKRDSLPGHADINTSSIPTLREAKEYIDSIDFSNIINKLVNRHKWARAEAEETCQQFRNYLWLIKKSGLDREQPLPPSEDIDEFWHHAILETAEYFKHCNAIFGRYLHHYPYLGIDGKTNMGDLRNYFKQTQQLYTKEFGGPITAVRFHGLIKYLMKILLLAESFGKWLKPKKYITTISLKKLPQRGHE